MDRRGKQFNDFGKSDYTPPLVPGSLRGYRAWYLDLDKHYRLRSTRPGLSTIWHRQGNTAVCLTVKDLLEVIDRGCICGSASCSLLAGKKIAQLESLNHRSPSSPSDDVYCGKCGFYAFHNPFPTKDQFSNYIPFAEPDFLVMGSIKATGFIVVGEAGFRSEYAEIEALCGENARAAAEYYQVPWFRTMRELQEQFRPAPEFVEVEI